MKTAEALLYARTIRHLRPAQLLGRARRVLPAGPVDRAPAPPRRSCAPLADPAQRDPILVGPTRVQMLGEAGDLASASDWNDDSRCALWRYHTHYFDDLRADGATARAEWNDALIDRWIGENEPGVGAGWEAYPTSLRIVNWVRWGTTRGLSELAVQSLAEQARHLRTNLEWHLLGNHLFANAKGLVFAGAFFQGREAGDWLGRGLSLLRRELDEQVLADGGHFERSPMYHALILEDVLDLIALVQAVPSAFARPGSTEGWLRGIADRMRTWLSAMTHPDGEIALFNDSAMGQAPSPGALESYARRLGLGALSGIRDGVTHLADSGYVRVALGDATLVLDVGEIGPAYLPGHAHADSLTFELSMDANRIIVDSGTSVYEPGAERLRQRGTAAHNTIEIDGENSSEIWSSFRVARRAMPRALHIDDRPEGVVVTCAHDGYRRLPGRATHTRTWSLRTEGLTIDDRIEGGFDRAVARLHLHPEVAAGPDLWSGGRGAQLTHAAGRRVDVRVDGASLEIERGTWHPGFGHSIPNEHLRCVLPPGASTTHCQLAW